MIIRVISGFVNVMFHCACCVQPWLSFILYTGAAKTSERMFRNIRRHRNLFLCVFGIAIVARLLLSVYKSEDVGKHWLKSTKQNHNNEFSNSKKASFSLFDWDFIGISKQRKKALGRYINSPGTIDGLEPLLPGISVNFTEWAAFEVRRFFSAQDGP